ncbi:MAG: hypothetical protein AAF546_04895 [Verrucomicrobiota bacterium]
MRTTLDIDDEVMHRIRRKALEEGKTLKELVNQALIRELQADQTTHGDPTHECPAFSMGAPRRQIEKALQLAEELEDEVVLQKFEIRK